MKLNIVMRAVMFPLIYLFLMISPLLQSTLFPPKNRDANRRLFYAILHNDTAGVKDALKAGANPNAEMEGYEWTDFIHPLSNLMKGQNDHLRDTPLLATMDTLVKREAIAARPDDINEALENVETVKALVEAGADVNAQSCIGETPLNMAASLGYYDTAHYLLEQKADPNLAEMGDTPCHFAASDGHTRILQDLLEHGANPNIKNILGDTPLVQTTWPHETPRQIEAVKILLAHHADATIKNAIGKTALDNANDNHRPEIAAILEDSIRKTSRLGD